MSIDTDKTNCSNCQFYEVYKTPQAVVEHPSDTKYWKADGL